MPDLRDYAHAWPLEVARWHHLLVDYWWLWTLLLVLGTGPSIWRRISRP